MRICIKTIVAAVAAIFLTLAAYGQETGVITLHGHVLDSSNSESLFFSSVSLSGSTISNVSNADGIFSLKIPENTPADARITISHLGFLTRTPRGRCVTPLACEHLGIAWEGNGQLRF